MYSYLCLFYIHCLGQFLPLFSRFPPVFSDGWLVVHCARQSGRKSAPNRTQPNIQPAACSTHLYLYFCCTHIYGFPLIVVGIKKLVDQCNGSVLDGALNNLTISQSALDGNWLVGLVVFLVLFWSHHLIGPTVILSSNVFLQLVFLGGREASGSTLLDTETDQKIVIAAPDWASSSSLVVRLQL